MRTLNLIALVMEYWATCLLTTVVLKCAVPAAVFAKLIVLIVVRPMMNLSTKLNDRAKHIAEYIEKTYVD